MESVVSLKGLVEVIGGTLTEDAIMNAKKQDRDFWPDREFPEGKHRRYNGFHGLCLVIVDMLIKQGLRMSDAAEIVRHQGNVIRAYLTAIATHQPPEQLFVTSFSVCKEQSDLGPKWDRIALSTSGTAEAIMDAMRASLENTGHVFDTGRRTIRQIGGPHVSIAPVGEAYRLLKQRAELAGYMVDGFNIHKIASEA